ncbi:telomere length regulation protein [Xylaria bambusicola]|uniref:telomere length regulation protein n=1 Tax=Xylaria bambusicola TaxID=326684 RepID=UPI002007CB27|nr:telomere length regulation protein [Xylaria bambusicola]KAI0515213.1 telomere length regulation protein [Xylaria bambusicola]
MADSLRLARPANKKGDRPDEFLSLSKATNPLEVPQAVFRGKSPEEALESLKNQPSYDTLLAILEYLQKGVREKHDFDIRKPGPLSAQIIHILVTEVIPNYWTVLREASDKGGSDLILACLRSLPGINATLTYIRSLIQSAKTRAKDSSTSHIIFNLIYTSSLLAALLDNDNEVMRVWDHIAATNDLIRCRTLRHEFLSLFTNGRIVSLSAEAADICRQAGQPIEALWTADSKQYIRWLAHTQARWVKSQPKEEDLKVCAELGARTLRLGHSEILVQTLLTELLLRDEAGKEMFSTLVNNYPLTEQRKVLLLVLKLLSDFYLNSINNTDANEEYPTIWASVGVLESIIANNDAQRDNLVTWLTSATGAGVGEGCGIRRAAVAALAVHRESISTVLERSLSQFSDQLYIKHAPILQQEGMLYQRFDLPHHLRANQGTAHAQVLLLSAGYVHRLAPMKLTILLRSSLYLNAISNRLAVSQNRARFLGMAVGEALSGLIHAKDTKLDFKMEEMATDEADWYKSLVHVSDKAGPLDPLRTSMFSSQPNNPKQPAKLAKEQRAPPSKKNMTKTGFIIEEVEDDEKQEDPDLMPYAKPDSDAEDSDDDPTLINRDKPKAPVYIRDLINYLRDIESYDKQKLALTTAPTLIRRKANYGTEVISHAEELASLLVGLQDKFELENFYNLRLQGMVAVIVAQPEKMAPWFAKTFFDGDYSLSQRASILIVLGLSGREIAGFDASEYTLAAQFPSKALPSKIEKHYLQPSSTSNTAQTGANLKALPPNALDTLAQSLSQTFLAPMAAEAADAATGPDALKLSSFTSRLNNSNANPLISSKSKSRGIRSIPNKTASVISTSFFFPLSSRFQAAMRSPAASKIIFQPYLLALYLKTLGLLVHAAGPSTLALPQMTAELWDLLLGVRGQCLGSNTTDSESWGDMAVTHAVLMALAALLDVNERDVRGLCERQGRQVVESMEWVGNLFHNTRGGEGAGEENDVKMLAAGILIRLREAVDKYQAVLMGDLVGFT